MHSQYRYYLSCPANGQDEYFVNFSADEPITLMLDTNVIIPPSKGMPMQPLHDAEAAHLYATADYHHFTLSSHFQPIFSISHRRPVGYEGLIRAVDAEQRPPFATRTAGDSKKRGGKPITGQTVPSITYA